MREFLANLNSLKARYLCKLSIHHPSKSKERDAFQIHSSYFIQVNSTDSKEVIAQLDVFPSLV